MGLSAAHNTPALIVGQRFFWNVGPRRAPDVAAEVVALIAVSNARRGSDAGGLEIHRRHQRKRNCERSGLGASGHGELRSGTGSAGWTFTVTSDLACAKGTST